MGQNFSGGDRVVFADFFPHFSAKTDKEYGNPADIPVWYTTENKSV
jgi:hypothetical protein